MFYGTCSSQFTNGTIQYQTKRFPRETVYWLVRHPLMHPLMYLVLSYSHIRRVVHCRALACAGVRWHAQSRARWHVLACALVCDLANYVCLTSRSVRSEPNNRLQVQDWVQASS
jgi:exonuclease I